MLRDRLGLPKLYIFFIVYTKMSHFRPIGTPKH